MDSSVVVSISTGLALRLFLGSLDDALLGLALLGIWEGTLIHHSNSFSNYLAYAFRILLDLFLTGSLRTSSIILAWTAVAFVVAEIISPTPTTTKRVRSTPSRPLPPHIRMYRPPITPDQTRPLTVTPPLDPNQPSSPPSFFLQGESDSPKFVPRYLPSALGSNESDSPPSNQILPTPPVTLVVTGPREHDTRRQLPPISEASEEDSKQAQSSPFEEPHPIFTRPLPSYAPSLATTAPPLTIPDPTMHSSHPNMAHNDDDDDLYFPSAAPIPVPIHILSSRIESPQSPATPSEPDTLTTPRPANWELTDNDELRTPIDPTRELSPLFSDRGVLSDFSPAELIDPITHPIPSFAPAQAPFDNPPASSPSTPAAGPSNPAKSAVEYPSSQAVAKGSPEPDTDKLSEAESPLETETDATSVISIRNSAQLYAVAEVLRNKARDKETDRLRLKQELSRAESEARIKDILFLREDIRLSEIEARKLHERAVRRFYKARNSSNKPQTVDVHGLRVAEAIQMTETALRQAFTSNYPYVKVIVGKGLHSQGGKPVLKQAIMRTMEGLKIPCKVDPNNPGVLILSVN